MTTIQNQTFDQERALYGGQDLLVQNCSTILYRDDTYGLLSGKYEMPVCLFYHMDFISCTFDFFCTSSSIGYFPHIYWVI